MGESQYLNRFRAEGELRAARDFLILTLQTRYPGSVSDPVTDVIENQTDYGVVDRWFRFALRAETFEQFFNAMHPCGEGQA